MWSFNEIKKMFDEKRLGCQKIGYSTTLLIEGKHKAEKAWGEEASQKLSSRDT